MSDEANLSSSFFPLMWATSSPFFRSLPRCSSITRRLLLTYPPFSVCGCSCCVWFDEMRAYLWSELIMCCDLHFPFVFHFFQMVYLQFLASGRKERVRSQSSNCFSHPGFIFLLITIVTSLAACSWSGDTLSIVRIREYTLITHADVGLVDWSDLSLFGYISLNAS